MSNRVIKFRGKRLSDGLWVYGTPIQTHVGTYIITEENPHICSEYGYMEIDEFSKVQPDTVGQSTGMTDKNGVEIYEGDIFTVNGKYPKVIEFRQDHSSFCMANISDLDKVYIYPWQQIRSDWWEDYSREIVVIGNKFDNPELMQ